jgi:hypothetical protein
VSDVARPMAREQTDADARCPFCGGRLHVIRRSFLLRGGSGQLRRDVLRCLGCRREQTVDIRVAGSGPMRRPEATTNRR